MMYTVVIQYLTEEIDYEVSHKAEMKEELSDRKVDRIRRVTPEDRESEAKRQ